MADHAEEEDKLEQGIAADLGAATFDFACCEVRGLVPCTSVLAAGIGFFTSVLAG